MVRVPPGRGSADARASRRGGGWGADPAQPSTTAIPTARNRSARVRASYTRQVPVVILLGWLAAFVAGCFIGLVPAIAVASALLGTLALATHARELAALFRPRPSVLALGL